MFQVGMLVVKSIMIASVALHGAGHHHQPVITVHSGDTLSSIAKHEYGSANRWAALWWTNRRKIHNPNLIFVGEKLHLSRWHTVKPWLRRAAMAALPAPSPLPAPVVSSPTSHPSAPSSGTSSPAPAPAPAPQPVPAPAHANYSAAPGSFEQCVIQRESGGDPTAVNSSSGAGGLYGFLPSTWQSLGFPGLPENASPAMQHQAFEKEYSISGGSAWSAYDGC